MKKTVKRQIVKELSDLLEEWIDDTTLDAELFKHLPCIGLETSDYMARSAANIMFAIADAQSEYEKFRNVTSSTSPEEKVVVAKSLIKEALKLFAGKPVSDFLDAVEAVIMEVVGTIDASDSTMIEEDY
jgi:hypothetical protein